MVIHGRCCEAASVPARGKEPGVVIADVAGGGFAEKTRQEAGMYLDHARRALEGFPASSEKDILLAMADFVLIREK